jgi:hypothetical protein
LSALRSNCADCFSESSKQHEPMPLAFSSASQRRMRGLSKRPRSELSAIACKPHGGNLSLLRWAWMRSSAAPLTTRRETFLTIPSSLPLGMYIQRFRMIDPIR